MPHTNWILNLVPQVEEAENYEVMTSESPGRPWTAEKMRSKWCLGCSHVTVRTRATFKS